MSKSLCARHNCSEIIAKSRDKFWFFVGLGGGGEGFSRRYTHKIIIAANNFLAQRLLDRASKIEE
jgi:hypothetical protein